MSQTEWDGTQHAAARLALPEAPSSESGQVKAWQQPVEILTYLPDAPDRNPMFLQKRVYQGSNGDVYPLPLIDRIAIEPKMKFWEAIHLENRYVRLMVMPEIGGRIHVGFDKISGYDFFYRQNVIKPALVGLAGPWISGGVEFNWPQHHRPGTFMPVETEIERHEDGSVTIWCSDYDRTSGMKGMHGVCLHPDSSVIELKARLYNATETVQTFLWWANVAARVHEGYQSFFPPDVRYVADHARRAISSFPLADGNYYGVNYGDRALHGIPQEEFPAQFPPDGYPANDLSRYANIPVPTSYMIVQTEGDFFGGYDHHARAGFVHIANRHIAPGKKQWTWGNHEFGYAWDRSLTNHDGPYVELMAGVYTDNQPDFSWLAPGETKTFSQFWYPLRGCGVPQAASLDAGLHLDVFDGAAHIAVCVTRELPGALLRLSLGGQVLQTWEATLTPQSEFTISVELPASCDLRELELDLTLASGKTLRCRHTVPTDEATPWQAVEPPLPRETASLDELYLTGVHLEQYRHATRSPEPYWKEALRRDPGDMRSNHALAKFYLRRCEYALAEVHARAAITRATQRNGNPYDSEIFYTLGLILRRLNRLEDAYAAFYKATWSAAWRSAGYHALGELDAVRGDVSAAINHLELSLLTNSDNLNARNLLVTLLRQRGVSDRAEQILAHTQALDPLDLWSRFLGGVSIAADGHALLALGLRMERGGQLEDAIRAFELGLKAQPCGASPLLEIAISLCSAKLGDGNRANRHMKAALEASPDYCFPCGPEAFDLLQYALAMHPDSAQLHALLGNLLYHHRRHYEAIAHWETAAAVDTSCSQVWRNLGIGYYNHRKDEAAARRAYDRAIAESPLDARLLYESDQLDKRLKVSAVVRLKNLESKPNLLNTRDDLSVERATLLNHLGQPQEALELLLSRQFQPWEGGEGMVLGQYTDALVALAQIKLFEGHSADAIEYLTQALHPPASLGEARHMLANSSNIYHWLGRALTAQGDSSAAKRMFDRSAAQRGDFQDMAVQAFSEMTYWSGLSLQHLGRNDEAKDLFDKMQAYAIEMEGRPASIDYFATSLPTLLLFEEDPEQRQRIQSRLLQAMAAMGLNETEASERLLTQVLEADPNNVAAMQFRHALERESAWSSVSA